MWQPDPIGPGPDIGKPIVDALGSIISSIIKPLDNIIVNDLAMAAPSVPDGTVTSGPLKVMEFEDFAAYVPKPAAPQQSYGDPSCDNLPPAEQLKYQMEAHATDAALAARTPQALFQATVSSFQNERANALSTGATLGEAAPYVAAGFIAVPAAVTAIASAGALAETSAGTKFILGSLAIANLSTEGGGDQLEEIADNMYGESSATVVKLAGVAGDGVRWVTERFDNE